MWFLSLHLLGPFVSLGDPFLEAAAKFLNLVLVGVDHRLPEGAHMSVGGIKENTDSQCINLCGT